MVGFLGLRGERGELVIGTLVSGFAGMDKVGERLRGWAWYGILLFRWLDIETIAS